MRFFLLLQILLLTFLVNANPMKDSSETVLVGFKPVHLQPEYEERLRKYPDTGMYTLPFLKIYLGGAIAFTNGNIRLDSENSKGTDIDTENDLGFPTSLFIPRFNIFLKLGMSNNIILDIYAAQRKETHVITKDINYGNTFFPVNSFLNSKFRFITYHLMYRQSFSKKERFNIGGLIGLTLIDFKLRLQGESQTQKENIFRPFPVIGLDAFAFLTKRVFVRGTVKFFTLPFGNTNYSLVNIKPSIEYYFTKNFGLGMRYNYVHFNLESDTQSFNGSVKYGFNAISLFTCFRFF